MPTFKLAHIHEQGQDMLLFPLNPDIGHKTPEEQTSILEELELRAHSAGLAGHAAIFWQSGRSTHSRGPTPWRGFLENTSFSAVLANLNREISW